MRPSRRPIIIATRRSPLAQQQAKAVAGALRRLHGDIEVKLLLIESEGDKLLDHPLAALGRDEGTKGRRDEVRNTVSTSDLSFPSSLRPSVPSSLSPPPSSLRPSVPPTTGGKGLFTAAIEQAVLDGRADIAVHSMKDVPTLDTPGLVIAAVPKRGDVRDCFIAHTAASIEQLPPGALVGTSSMRRAAQLHRLRPDLRIEPLRGNIDSRMRKVLIDKKYDATLLAMAGLIRGGHGERATNPLDVNIMLPSAGQAALAIQCRADDHVTLRRCLPLNDAISAACVEAERAVVAALGADCRSPLAVLAQPVDHANFTLRARAMCKDGSTILEAEQTGSLKRVKHVTRHVVETLQAKGAKQILRS
ncbi:MAG: hydroxymethylbilane synthase [Phycisphaeraceae bacterium]